MPDDEIVNIRQRMHDVADQLNAALLRQENLQGQLNLLVSRLDTVVGTLEKIAPLEGRVITLETRHDEARAISARWGGVIGAAAAALVSWLMQIVIGGHR